MRLARSPSPSPPEAAPCSDSVSLRLRPEGLRLATRDNSQAHSSIGTPSGLPALAGRHSPPTACGHTVSGSLSLPSRGSFHLSLTVLVRYRSSGVFSLGGWSPRLPTGFHVSRGTRERGPGSPLPFGYGAFTLFGPPFQDGSPREGIGNFPTGPQPGPATSHNPPRATPAGLAPAGFGLFPFRSPLLRESRLISFPPGTEMFQFPGFPPHRLWIPRWVTGHDPRRVSPFGDVRIAACSAAPRTFRRRQRPSSAPDAKASTVRPFSLDGFPLRSSWKKPRSDPCVRLSLCGCQGSPLCGVVSRRGGGEHHLLRGDPKPSVAGTAATCLRDPGVRRRVLLRKEVIQPHVPVRLPCYDFVPVTDPTFDGSLPCGLGHRLRVEPAPMT